MSSRNLGIVLLVLSLINYSEYARILHRNRLTPNKLEAKIVGGTEASIESYPFAVQFFNRGGMCGGAIINSWTVVTSAHCLTMNTDTDHMIVQAGSKYMYDFYSNKYNIKSFVIHEDYNKVQTFACDIALLFLKTPLQFSKLVKKTIIVENNVWMKENKTKFIVAGWGWTKYGGEVSNSLMMTSLHYVPAAKCSKLHNNYELSPDMFCLYGGGKTDTCRGDSGGGVLWNDMLVGLTSHGNGCANKNSPSIYTNLWMFRDWIKDNVKRFISEYCMEKDLTRYLKRNKYEIN